jgi:hypothetical protein
MFFREQKSLAGSEACSFFYSKFRISIGDGKAANFLSA